MFSNTHKGSHIMCLILQSTRLEEQRTTLPRGGAAVQPHRAVVTGAGAAAADINQMSAPTVPDEDFFSMISRLQVNLYRKPPKFCKLWQFLNVGN